MSSIPEWNVIVSPLKSLLFCTIGATSFLLLHLFLGWLWGLMYICRRLVILLSKMFVSGVGKPLSWTDAFLAENYNERHRLSMVAIGTFRGDISLATGQSLGRHLLEEREEGPGRGRLRYPELQQFQTSFLGFRFWKNDPTFHLDNHCKEVIFSDEPHFPSYLKSYEGMVAEFSRRPYPPRRSPWEAIVLRGFREEEDGELYTVVIGRAHHTLMDISSGVNLLNKFFKGRSPVAHIPKAKTLQLPDGFKVSDFLSLSHLAGFFSGLGHLPFQIMRNLRVKRLIADERRKRGGGKGIKDKVHCKLTSKLPLSQVKDVAARLGVRVPALLSTLIADNLAKVLPPGLVSIPAVYAMPLPKHPTSLTNHLQAGQMELPLCRTKSIQSNCTSINDLFMKLKFDPSVLVIGYLSFLVGHCPSAVATFINSSLGYYPILISNFAVSSQGFDVEGAECVDARGGMAPPPKVTDCMIASYGFKSHIRMFLASNDDFLSEDELERIAVGIGEDFAKLLDDVNSNDFISLKEKGGNVHQPKAVIISKQI